MDSLIATCKRTATSLLRSSPAVAALVDSRGYVPILAFMDIFERETGITLTFELITSALQKCRSLHVDPEGYIAARFGHQHHVLHKMLMETREPFSKYTGPLDVFCFTHTDLEGLGAINSGRKMNVLMLPEKCENKGVKAYVSISSMRRFGIPVWQKAGNEGVLFCFDRCILPFVFKTEFTDEAAARLCDGSRAEVRYHLQAQGYSDEQITASQARLVIEC